MVDLKEEQTLSVSVVEQPSKSSTERSGNRRYRQRPRSAKKPSEAEENRTPNQSDNQRKSREPRERREPRENRAPRLAQGSEEETQRTPLLPVDGVLELKVSVAKPRDVYARLVRLYLAGSDGSGKALEGTSPVETVRLCALGGAIAQAIYINDNLVKNGVCSSEKVEVEYAELEDRKEGTGRHAAKIVLTLRRLASWNPSEDSALKRHPIYRKFTGQPEEKSS